MTKPCEKMKTLEGQPLKDWEAHKDCPRCEGELESVDPAQQDRGEPTGTTDYECIECWNSFTHTPGVSLTWF